MLQEVQVKIEAEAKEASCKPTLSLLELPDPEMNRDLGSKSSG